MKRRMIPGLAAMLLLVACSSQDGDAARADGAEAALHSEATSKQVMLGLSIPASDVLWGVGSKAPENDTEWDRVTANAVMLAESGLMLLQPPRDVGQPEWTRHARDLVTHARAAAAAAQQRDVDALLAAGDEIYNVCEACHNTYMPAKVAEQAAAGQ